MVAFSLTMTKQLIRLALFLVALLATVTPAFAQQYGGQYGSTTTPSDLTVNKMVRSPLPPYPFVENLGDNDITHSPDSQVVFSITVYNSGNQRFEEIKVDDYLIEFPQRIISAEVDQEFEGSFSNNRLTFKIKNLDAGQNRTVEVRAKIAPANVFPTDRSLFCDNTNKVEVRSEDRYDDDTAKFCIRTNVLGVTTLPEAGLEDYLPMLPFIGMGAVGMYLTLKKRLS
ncbi:MAG: hypothetical protein UV59_C0003G0059 [Candidatus Gottesmanbacteria bacterium GW2011_GWA1_43_11]|uniref:DUF11 domain-containing protein n=1 Tax=Candidatus Gottesmanbacteria bacterium GW2011_GWA1_43_11 TaxID=1618436 RepID=A0A0G1CKM8_9BACT|nr:MAG: hypothetical protein UV59_C0003G0059 [Candidatus Gottesmanbacteria bacterium GW2011_GWA1_43_11]